MHEQFIFTEYFSELKAQFIFIVHPFKNSVQSMFVIYFLKRFYSFKQTLINEMLIQRLLTCDASFLEYVKFV